MAEHALHPSVRQEGAELVERHQREAARDRGTDPGDAVRAAHRVLGRHRVSRQLAEVLQIAGEPPGKPECGAGPVHAELEGDQLRAPGRRGARAGEETPAACYW